MGERYRKPLEGLPALKRGAGSFTKHSHFWLKIKKKQDGSSFIVMDIMSMIHNFHIFYLNVHVCFLFCNLQFALFYSSLVSLCYSMVWSIGGYFADLICLNLSDSANGTSIGSKEQLQSLDFYVDFYHRNGFGFSLRSSYVASGKRVTQLQILFPKLTSRFWRTARIWICWVWSNFSEYIYFVHKTLR